MKPRGRQMMAWLLTAAVTLSGNSFTVLADEMDVQVQQETTGNEEVFVVDTTENTQDEVVDVEDSAEISFDEEMQDEIQIEDAEGSEAGQEAELQIEEDSDETENLILGGLDDVSVFSSEDENINTNVEYYFPEDDVILLDWPYDIKNEYDGWAVDEESPDGRKIDVPVTDVTVTNVPDENESEEIASIPVCEIESSDNNGWRLLAKRFGTAEVTLTYTDYYGKEKEYTFYIHVNGEKYILQAQYPVSDNNLLRNSEQEFPFTVRHLWRYNDENQDDVELENTEWALNFAPNEDGWKYDTKLLKDVSLNDNKVTVKSGNESGGTDILLKAVINTENGPKEALCNLWVNVRNDYDVLYPESLDVATGKTLNLNDPEVGLCVKNVKENEETGAIETTVRNDVTYEVEYDENQWENSAEEGKLPILTRMTNEGTELTIIAKNEEGRELCRRNYQFAYEDYSVWFDNLREDEYSTYFYADEEGALELNTDNLGNKEVSISWEVGYRTEEQNEESDSFVSEGIPEDNIFWSTNDKDPYSLSVDGRKLSDAYKWLREKKGENFWFEARAHVKANDVEVYMAQAGINIRDCVEDYELPEDEVLLKDENRFINKEFGCQVKNGENQEGNWIPLEFTALYIENDENDEDMSPVCEIEDEDEYGWSIIARRYGTAVITLEYEDLSGNPQKHSFRYYVNSDRYTLEPQWGASEGNMLRNSEMELGFVLLHDWRNDDDEQYGVEAKDWELALAPDDNNWSYDTNLLHEVTIKDGKTLVIKSGEETWGTDISLKAMIPTEDGNKEEVTFDQVHIEVREEYDILYPTDIANLNVGKILDPEKDLEVVRITDDGEKKIKVNHYDVDYDSAQWEEKKREGRLPLLKRKSADNCWLDIIAIDEEDNEIRRHYEFEWLDYSVWFENLRGDSGDYTFAFEDEQYELSLNTENLDERGVKDSAEIIWSVGYAYTDENGKDIPKTDIPKEYTFWSENPKDNSKLIIDSGQLTKAYDWLHTQISGVCWFEIRAGVELGGVIVSEEAYTGLGEVCKNEEEYYINFGVTLNMVPGDTLWIDDFLEGSIRDKDHPYGEEIRVDVTKVSVDDISCCRVAYQGNGWSIKALKCGTATLKLVYTDYHGKQQSGEYTVSVQDETYWMNYNLERSEMLPGETKEFTISVYRATEDNPDGEVVDPAENKYSVTVEKCNSKDPIEVTADENGKITINVDKNAGLRQSYGFDISVESEARDEEGNPIWSVDGDVYVNVMERYPDKIQLAKEVNLNPALGDTFDINEYKPTLLRYNPALEADDKWEALTIDNKKFKFVLDWDESVWTEQDKNSLPVLKRTGKARGAIVLRAEEYDPDSEDWYEIARDSYYVSTIFDKDAECSHIWETIVDEKGNCGKAEKRHQICTACQKTEHLPDIPATGRHTMSGWKVTKQANALTEGMKEQTCTECGLKQQQTLPKLTATLTLNVPENKTLPMKMKQTYQLKVSGLADGDKVVSWTSSNKKIATVSGSGKLKALKKKGKTTITVKLASGKTAKFTVKVQKADVATTSLTVLNKATGKKMPKTVSLKVKKKLSLTATVAPVTSKQKVTYSTSNKRIATVNAKGVITAKKKGTVTITVKSGKKKVKVKVKVTK